MANKFSTISSKRLSECHPDLQLLFKHVLARVDISIACGYRPKDEQDAAYEGGFSSVKWPKSRHNSWPSEAVDVIPYPSGYKATQGEWERLAEIVFEEAELLGVQVEWGGRWTSFIDRPHWQIKR